MKIIKAVSEEDVFKEWIRSAESSTSKSLSNLGLKWSLVRLTKSDIDNLYIISSFDWTYKHRLTLTSKTSCSFAIKDVHKNYLRLVKDDEPKALEILARKVAFMDKSSNISNKLIFISSDGINLVCMEGNRRLIALYDIKKLVGLEVYVGIGNVSSYGHYSPTNSELINEDYMIGAKDKIAWIHKTPAGTLLGKEYKDGDDWYKFIRLYKRDVSDNIIFYSRIS